jgi:tricorn protease
MPAPGVAVSGQRIGNGQDARRQNLSAPAAPKGAGAMMRVLLFASLMMMALGATAAGAQSHLMRYADIHGNLIVFTYEDDLWLAPSDGGDAWRLTSHPGVERYARFSPDGHQIAFTGQYDGGTDIYVMDATGGVPQRLTYHPSPDLMLDWYPDGQSLLFRSRREYPFRAEELYRISLTGGMPERLPIDRGGLASLSADGERLAYNRISRETATWKRYQGGMAQDVWLADFRNGAITKITDWIGTDNYPMWYGESVYFTSDRDRGTLNIFSYDTTTGQTVALTQYGDYDVKYPSMGDGRIVFQYGEELHVLDLADRSVRKVPVNIRSDRVYVRPELVSVAPNTGSFGLSPSGKRVLLEARGEILNLPAEEGDPVNLTDTSASREKNAAWSPDGRWIAFVSDRSGEEQIYLVDQKGAEPWRQLTKDNQGFLLPLVWSPDSKHLIYGDKFLRLNMIEIASGKVTRIDQADYDDAWERWGIQDYVWSPCGKWIAYTKMEQSMNESVYLYSLQTKTSTRLTDDMTTDWSPSFDPEGRYLYFLSNRTFRPVMGFQDQNHVFLDMGLPYVVLLQDGQPSPFMPKDGTEDVAQADGGKKDAGDEPRGKGKNKDKDKDEDAGGKASVSEPTVIDLEGIGRRILAVEGMEPGNYFRLEATDDGFVVLRKNENEFLKYQAVTDQSEGDLELLGYSLEDKEAKTLLEGIANYHLSADGKKLIYRAGSKYGVVDAGEKAAVGDGAVDLAAVRIRVDRAAEYLQIFNEAWRVQRDWFYDPNLHGVDWRAIGEKYRRFVPFCGERGDLDYLIGEMIAELNIGHTYVYGGDFAPGAERVRTGLLGAVFETPPRGEYHRIARVMPGVPWDPDQRSPLAEPGCPVKAGAYLLAIDGQTVTSRDNVHRFLIDKAEKIVTLTFNDKPSLEGASTCRVKTIGSDFAVRYREWVEDNRAKVERVGGGKIGYMHLPNMMEDGLIEFARAFYPLYARQALIIDERYNGGGFVGDMIIDRLERRLWGLTVPREGGLMRDPERCFHGPIVVLINEDTGSNGEYFAEAIKLKGLATIIGVRTWGGAVGIEPHQDLVDGGVTTPPQFGLLGLDGTWLIEGHGVDPDIVVQNMPADVVAGQDAQLEAAVDFLLRKLQTDKQQWTLPHVRNFPDKSKAGGSSE